MRTKIIHSYKNKLLNSILFCLVIVILGEGFLYVKNKTSFLQHKKDLPQFAKQVLLQCNDAKSKPACYDKTIPQLMNRLSMEEAFAVTRIVQSQDEKYPYCHVLGHKLSAQETAKDPSQWKDVLRRCPSGVCSNGCLHGVLQEKFRQESLSTTQLQSIIPDLKTVCEATSIWFPTDLEQASCYHALGHLTMYLSKADIPTSLTMCDAITVKDDGRNFQRVCYDGVFMQIFQPLEMEDKALIKGKEPTKETVASFCNVYEGAKKGSCLNESWPLFANEIESTPKALTTFCQRDTQPEETQCYHALFYVLMAQFNLDTNRMHAYCQQIADDEVQMTCFADTATRLLETDYQNGARAVAFCDNAPATIVSSCMSHLSFFATFTFHKGSIEHTTFCNLLKEPWKKQCLQ